MYFFAAYVGRRNNPEDTILQRHKSMDNVKMDLAVIGLGGVDWIGLDMDREKWRALVNAAMNVCLLQNARELPSGFTICGLSISLRLYRVSYIHCV
jgi:hypothetical protein